MFNGTGIMETVGQRLVLYHGSTHFTFTLDKNDIIISKGCVMGQIANAFITIPI